MGMCMGRVMPIPILIPVPAPYLFLAYSLHTHFFQFFIPIPTINGAGFSDSSITHISKWHVYYYVAIS